MSTVLLVVKEAVPVLDRTGSGVLAGGGVFAGWVTVNVARNCVPFSNRAVLPFFRTVVVCGKTASVP